MEILRLALKWNLGFSSFVVLGRFQLWSHCVCSCMQGMKILPV